MKNRTILYIGISVFCIIAIGLGMYYQIFVAGNEQFNEITPQNETENRITQEETQEELKAEFDDLFDNNLHEQVYEQSAVQTLTVHAVPA